MGLLKTIFKREEKHESSFIDLELFYDLAKRPYLKKMALETCINFIGRTISLSKFRIVENGKRVYDDWDYLLNVRPNAHQSASEFWHHLVYKLIYDNEVLVILSDTNDLLIADDFTREEYAVYPDTFRDVTVKDYTFQRTFRMDEVIYLTYHNVKLSRFMDGMFEDYSELYARMLEAQKRSNQIRGTVGIDSTQQLDEKGKEQLQAFIDRLFESFQNKSVALVPKLKGFEYNEVADGSNNGKSVDELTKLKRDLVDVVANILGIPSSLLYGDMSEYETAIKAYNKFCISPLLKKIHDELNAKTITKAEYMQGKRVYVYGVTELNPLELANAVDKLRASGVYNANEIRVKLGDEPVDNPALDEYVLTKNYESTLKGGEGDDD